MVASSTAVAGVTTDDTNKKQCTTNKNEKVTNTSNNNDDINSSPTKKKEEQPFSLRIRYLLLPYLLGMIWIFLFPIVSVVTGELKCRGLFIDEKGFIDDYLKVGDYGTIRRYYDQSRRRRENIRIDKKKKKNGLCDALSHDPPVKNGNGVNCHFHKIGPSNNETMTGGGGGLDIVRVIPSTIGTMPSEALVLIVKEWSDDNHLHVGLLSLLDSLSKETYLAKIVYIVSKSCDDDDNDDDNECGRMSLDDVVKSFMDSYLGTNHIPNTPLLPSSYRNPILRNVIVLDDIPPPSQSSISSSRRSSSGGKMEVNVMVQGQRGVLPNLDLVFVALKIFGTSFSNIGLYPSVFDDGVERLNVWSRLYLPRSMWSYVRDLVGMFTFAASMVIGPHPPHAPLLDYNIDSITLQITPYNTTNNQQALLSQTIILLQKIEGLLRSLSNLHEKLHHSVFQYLLPSTTTFVGFGEYTYPCILLVLPLGIRALALVFKQMHNGGTIRFSIACQVVILCFSSSGLLLLATMHSSPTYIHVMDKNMHLWYTMVYLATLVLAHRVILANTNHHKQPQKRQQPQLLSEQYQTIQLAACAIAAYIHVPLTLAHVSLAAPSSALFAPLLSIMHIPSSSTTNNSNEDGCGWRVILSTMIQGMIWIVTFPPLFLVPKVFGMYTTYVLFVYTPLHLLYGILSFRSVVTMMIVNTRKKKRTSEGSI